MEILIPTSYQVIIFFLTVIFDYCRTASNLWTLKKYKSFKKKGSFQDSSIAVLITGKDESESLGGTILSLKKSGFLTKNIYFANDGSEDDSFDVAAKLIPNINIIDRENVQKPHAMRTALRHIFGLKKYRYIVFADADLVYDPNSGVIPLKKIFNNKSIAAASCNIIPVIEKGFKKNLFSRILISLQRMEYAYSMMLGRKASGIKGHVSCASGAFSVWDIEKALEVFNHHSMIFTGDDEELTKIALSLGYRIRFMNINVFTHAPSTLASLHKQRTVRWWPGRWRNMNYSMKIIKNSQHGYVLRLNMLYDMVSILLDPLKILSLMFLFLFREWNMIVALYMFYFSLSHLIYLKIEEFEGKKINIGTTILWPLYIFFQMYTRMYALVVYFNEKYIKNEWKTEKFKVDHHSKKYFFCILCFLPLSSMCQRILKDSLNTFKVEYRYGYVSDVLKDTKSFENQHSFYLGYKNTYIETTTAPVNIISLGHYIKVKRDGNIGVFEPRFSYRYKNPGGSMGVTYTHWWKKKVIPFFGGALYFNGRPNDILSTSKVPLINTGVFYIPKEFLLYSVSIFQDLSDIKKTTLVTRLRYTPKKYSLEGGLSFGTFNTYGVSARIGYNNFFIHSSYLKRIDFTQKNRFIAGLGLSLMN